MRNERELFELMLEHQDLFKFGMCLWIINLWINKIFQENELKLIHDYLEQNKPKNSRPHWFPIDELQPRIEWINQQIEKLSETENN